jgi:outer membrane lipoprotein-sorting protein
MTWMVVAAALWLPSVAVAQEDRAREILDAVDDVFRSTSSRSVMKMTVQTEHYKRTLKMESWSKGEDKSLVRILEPLKERGTATLKSGKNLYTYLPRTDRTIRLTSGMMQGSWMGSHFTNDDLVKESRLADDYTYKITFEGERGGQGVIEITLTPREEAAVSWGRIVVTVGAKHSLPLEQRYYDEDQALARTVTFSQIKELGGRRVPTRMRMVPADAPAEFTQVDYEQIEFEVKLKDATFSKASLKR